MDAFYTSYRKWLMTLADHELAIIISDAIERGPQDGTRAHMKMMKYKVEEGERRLAA